MSSPADVRYHKDPKKGYLKSPTVLGAGETVEYSEAELSEYLKCKSDPVYFARNYIKIISLDKGLVLLDLFKYQEELLRCFDKNRFTLVLSGRQTGKSVTIVAYSLWEQMFKSDHTTVLMAHTGAMAGELLARFTLALENLPYFLQPGCKILNKRSIEFSNNNKIFASAGSGRGYSINTLIADEFAFRKDAEDFYTAVFPVVSSGKNTKIIISSTPNGQGNMFHKLWEGAIQGINEYVPFKVDWYDVPGRDEAWKAKMISNTSVRQFSQEYSCLSGNSIVTVKYPSSVPFSTTIARLREIYWPGMEIETPMGFKKFSGVLKTEHDSGIRIEFEDGTYVECTENHRFAVGSSLVTASELRAGSGILGKIILDVKIVTDRRPYYDPVEVAGDHIYSHDDTLSSHNCEFLGSSNTLISSEALLLLRAEEPIRHDFVDCFRVFRNPVKGHTYIMCADIAKGRGKDYSTLKLIDISVSPFEEVAIYQSNMISPQLLPTIMVKIANQYNEAYVIVESNDSGETVLHILRQTLEYENLYIGSNKPMGAGLHMNAKVKAMGCSNLKDLIEAGKIKIHDARTIAELSSFVAKGDSFAASGKNHDDLVMPLVAFAYFMQTDTFTEMTDINLRELLFAEKMREIEDDAPLMGFFDDGQGIMGGTVERDSLDDSF